MSTDYQWLTGRQFAAAAGCDEKQVRRALASGRLVARADGRIDRAQLDAAWRRPRADGREPPVRSGRPESPAPISLFVSDALQRLRALDWGRPFDWSPSAQHQRLVGAATAVGLEVVQSDLRDDGHWGGYQLRSLEQLAMHGLCRDAIDSGFGFELDCEGALRQCRWWIDGADLDPDDSIEVRLDLLPLLAFPLNSFQKPPE